MQQRIAIIFYIILTIFTITKIGLEYHIKSKREHITHPTNSNLPFSKKETQHPNDGVIVNMKYDPQTRRFVRAGGAVAGLLEAKGFTPEPREAGMYIPALKPGESYELFISESELTEAGLSFERGYAVELLVQILEGDSEYFAVFQTNSQHEDIYKSSKQNQLYGGDSELYCTTSGVGLLGEYHGGNLINGETVRLRTHIAFQSNQIKALSATRLAKYVNDRYVGIQYVRQIERFKLKASDNMISISFFCDNNNETLPCIVSEIIIR